MIINTLYLITFFILAVIFPALSYYDIRRLNKFCDEIKSHDKYLLIDIEKTFYNFKKSWFWDTNYDSMIVFV